MESVSGGQIGYIHLRSMEREAFSHFAEQFYPVHRRAGLIVDVRHNRGGNVDAWVLQRLMTKAWEFFQPRVGTPYWNQPGAFRGHIVILIDQCTQSNGEAFAEGAKRLGIGKVIGMRTWGGQIWITDGHSLQDGSTFRIPEIGAFGIDGDWIVEGHGVEPSLLVDNTPWSTYRGMDAQLETAIANLRDTLASDPPAPVVPPPYPRMASA